MLPQYEKALKKKIKDHIKGTYKRQDLFQLLNYKSIHI